MPKKTFNSDSARELASKYKLKLVNIHTTRADNKVTVKNVQDTMKALKKMGPIPVQVQGNNVELLIKPIIVLGNENLIQNQKNLNLLKKWWEQRVPWGSDPVVGHKVALFKNVKGPSLLKLSFIVTEPEPMETEISIENAADPDKDGNYPIYIKMGQIVSINRNESKGGQPALVSGRIVKSYQA